MGLNVNDLLRETNSRFNKINTDTLVGQIKGARNEAFIEALKTQGEVVSPSRDGKMEHTEVFKTIVDRLYKE